MTVVLCDDLDMPGVVDRETCTVWVPGDQTDDEIIAVVNEAMRVLLSQRPRLKVVGAESGQRPPGWPV
jgi:hypothetical protein